MAAESCYIRCSNQHSFVPVMLMELHKYQLEGNFVKIWLFKRGRDDFSHSTPHINCRIDPSLDVLAVSSIQHNDTIFSSVLFFFFYFHQPGLLMDGLEILSKSNIEVI